MGKKRKTTKPPENETDAEKFVRVVTPRINKAVKAIDLIGNCAGTGYVHTPKQVGNIVNILSKAVERVTAAYTKTGKATEGFKFDS